MSVSPALKPAPLRILVVCTANRCRSPAAEVLLWRALVEAGVAAVVRSAGFLEAGRPVDRTMAGVLAARGINVESHRSTQVDAELLTGFDLILTMERRHARELIVLGGRDLPVFTLRSFANARPVEGDARDAIARMVRARAGDELAGDDRPDEVADPIGEPASAHRSVVDELTELTRSVASVLSARPSARSNDR
jgi:protein-tyrosine phosphatase